MKNAVFVILLSLFAAFVGFFSYGWVENIILLAHMTMTPMTGMFVLRIVGIFVPPLGAILGLFF